MSCALTSSSIASSFPESLGPGKQVLRASLWKTGPNAEASLAKVVAFKDNASSFCVIIPSNPEGMMLLSSGDGIDRLSNAKTRRQTPSASFIKYRACLRSKTQDTHAVAATTVALRAAFVSMALSPTTVPSEISATFTPATKHSIVPSNKIYTVDPCSPSEMTVSPGAECNRRSRWQTYENFFSSSRLIKHGTFLSALRTTSRVSGEAMPRTASRSSLSSGRTSST